MIRITNHMMMNNYAKGVSDAFASANKAMEHAIDYRRFDEPSDDPLAASQTFDVHWMLSLNDNYSTNVSNLTGIITTADKLLQNVDALLTNADTGNVLQSINGTMNSDNRKIVADQLINIRNEIVSQMNSQYAGGYMFGGSNDTDTPFKMVGDQLYYRGVNVDTGKLESDPSKTFDLDKLANETTYVDIGLGMKYNDDDTIDPQSVFNSSMPGIAYLGYGTDSNGNPKNVCSLLTKISDTLNSVSGSEMLSTADLDKITSYINTFRESHEKLRGGQAAIGQKLQFLDSTSHYISQVNLNLKEKDNEVEYLSPYDAIGTFYSQKYCYEASLKVGAQILQQSLMDYLK